MLRHRVKLTVALIVFLGNLSAATFAADLKSIKNGRWSDPKVWQPAQVPGDGDKVVVSSGTEIDYDAASDDVIHSIRVSGKLVFARNRQTLLNVALITVAPDGRDSDTVHDVHEDKHTHQKPHGPATAVLEVGTQA
ncbi:MAG: G8 domain-containing protein, partial [Pirellulales bacterium]